MKREFVTKLFTDASIEIPKEILDAIMNENGKDIEAEKSKATKIQADADAAQTEATSLKAQIAQRDADIETLKAAAGTSEELQAKYSEIQAKYATDTAALEAKLTAQAAEAKKQMEEQTYGFAAEKFFADVPFASELARKAALADFKEKGFKLENDKFLGGEDWLKGLKETDPGSFAPDEDGGGNPPPRFVDKTKQGGGGGDNNPFGNMGFSYVRQPPAQEK